SPPHQLLKQRAVGVGVGLLLPGGAAQQPDLAAPGVKPQLSPDATLQQKAEAVAAEPLPEGVLRRNSAAQCAIQVGQIRRTGDGKGSTAKIRHGTTLLTVYHTGRGIASTIVHKKQYGHCAGCTTGLDRCILTNKIDFCS